MATENTAQTVENTPKRPGRKAASGVRISARIGEGLYEKLQEIRWSERYEKIDHAIEALLDEAVQARAARK